MLKAIIFHLRRILVGLIAAPGRMLRSLLGGGVPVPPVEEFEDVVDEQVEELREELDAGPEKPELVTTSLGARIHEYAAGDRDSRGSFDFGGMPEHVAIALCTMPPEQLHRLTLAGPVICDRWAAGEKSGLVGVPLPKKGWAPDVSGTTRDEEPAHVLALAPEGERPLAELPGLAA